MTPAENNALDVQSLRNERRKKAKGHKFDLFEEIQCPTDEAGKSHIIKGVFAWGETSAWIGPPGSLKSALMASAAVDVASGSDCWLSKQGQDRSCVLCS
jgi:AAA domain